MSTPMAAEYRRVSNPSPPAGHGGDGLPPFEELMRRYSGLVYSTCYRITRDAHDAEDATQATFLTLAVELKTGQPIRHVAAWLQQVARRMALNLRRGKNRRKKRELIHGEMARDRARDGAEHQAPECGLEETRRIVSQELEQLPARYRLPLILHYFGGLSHEELARELSCRPSTLRVRLHRARAMLVERLSKRGMDVAPMAIGAVLERIIHAAVTESIVSAVRAARNLSDAFPHGGEVWRAAAAAKVKATIGATLLVATALAAAGRQTFDWIAIGGSYAVSWQDVLHELLNCIHFPSLIPSHMPIVASADQQPVKSQASVAVGVKSGQFQWPWRLQDGFFPVASGDWGNLWRSGRNSFLRAGRVVETLASMAGSNGPRSGDVLSHAVAVVRDTTPGSLPIPGQGIADRTNSGAARSRVAPTSKTPSNDENGAIVLSSPPSIYQGQVVIGSSSGVESVGPGETDAVTTSEASQTGEYMADDVSFGQTLSISPYLDGSVFSANSDADFGAVPPAPMIAIDINGGTLLATGSFALSANRDIGIGPATGNGNYTATLDAMPGTILTVPGVITTEGNGGTDNLTIAPSGGTVVLTANNNYSGATTIAGGGTLQLGNGGNTGSMGQGAVLDNGSLIVDRANNININSAISGAGSLRQIGEGTLTLSGIDTYSGGTLIDSGELSVTGSLLATSDVVLDGGLLAGNTAPGDGVGNVLLENGAISPGTATAAIGTLNLSSLYASAGTLDFSVAAGVSSTLNVAGMADFSGVTTIQITPAGVGSYTLLTAESLAGTAPQLIAPDGHFNYTLDFDRTDNQIILDVETIRIDNVAPFDATPAIDLLSPAGLPEPCSAALLLAGGAALMMRRRRRG
ncbi:MAG TPA: sigma-70 family RNA polymerase sigma factor [Tepidisphaeraceae bacterium]|nr:sigma-70 family RNA polymerase sigma factor [Tepidisphaeraceae bacterium]